MHRSPFPSSRTDPSTSDVSDPDNVTLGFLTSGGTHTVDYTNLDLNGAFPGTISANAASSAFIPLSTTSFSRG